MISAVSTALLQAEQGTSKHSHQADRKQERRVSWGACHAQVLGTLRRTPTGRDAGRQLWLLCSLDVEGPETQPVERWAENLAAQALELAMNFGNALLLRQVGHLVQALRPSSSTNPDEGSSQIEAHAHASSPPSSASRLCTKSASSSAPSLQVPSCSRLAGYQILRVCSKSRLGSKGDRTCSCGAASAPCNAAAAATSEPSVDETAEVCSLQHGCCPPAIPCRQSRNQFCMVRHQRCITSLQH